jgi:O-antigen ligase
MQLNFLLLKRFETPLTGVFSFNFIALCFVMFSCWFPTGFASTFSWLAFISASLLFLSNPHKFQFYELAGLGLFGWLLLSIFWSKGTISENVGSLLEYRFYFMLPVLTAALLSNDTAIKWGLRAIILGCLIALVTSYGLGLGWWQIEGAERSLGNRIYHGFIMSIFLLLCLLATKYCTSGFRLLFMCLVILTIYNLINIENGRTGYLLVAATLVSFTIYTFTARKILIIGGLLIGFFFLAYFWLDQFHVRIDDSISNLVKAWVEQDYHSSIGLRFEFYRAALSIFSENPIIGVGVGDVPASFAELHRSGELRFPTDNVHSEFLNMLVSGGGIAGCLFSFFILSVGHTGLTKVHTESFVGNFLVGMATILFVSALFNSTIKDFGEKHALLVVLALLGAASTKQIKEAIRFRS